MGKALRHRRGAVRNGRFGRRHLEGKAVASNTTGISATNGATVATRGTNTESRNGTDADGTPYSTLMGL